MTRITLVIDLIKLRFESKNGNTEWHTVYLRSWCGLRPRCCKLHETNNNKKFIPDLFLRAPASTYIYYFLNSFFPDLNLNPCNHLENATNSTLAIISKKFHCK
jgi:hypothetical protein